MNKNQKAFLKTLLRSVEQAERARDSILGSVDEGLITGSHRQQCIEYCRALRRYIDSSRTIATECVTAYGEPSTTIAAKAIANQQKN